MKTPYRDNLPVVAITVVGRASHPLDAHIDFAASRTIIPAAVAETLQLHFAGFERVATAAGIVFLPQYEAIIEAFAERHSMLVGALDLPAEAPVRALLGRDLLDRYTVCLNGKSREIEIIDP